jgi:hypothetical protein
LDPGAKGEEYDCVPAVVSSALTCGTVDEVRYRLLYLLDIYRLLGDSSIHVSDILPSNCISKTVLFT